jgi:hypothetical protein
MTRVLLTTTSFQDTPGIHHDMLAATGFEIVRERGPLPESRMLELAGQFDAYLCGDDAMTRAVMEKSLPRLKVISKYGIGLDKIDLKSAADLKLPVLFTPGVNHTTVAEHTFALLLATVRNLVVEANHTAAGRWTRITGNELCGKTIALIGLGRISKEVAIRARAFGLVEDAQDEPGVVRCGVGVGEAPFEARRPRVRGAEEELLAVEARVPPLAGEEVVEDETRPDEGAARAVPAVEGEEEADRVDEAGGLRQQPVPLPHRLPGQLQVPLSEVAQPAVQQLRGAARGA